MKTLIAVPCMDTVPVGHYLSMINLEKGPGVDIAAPSNSLIYDSRNMISLTAIEKGYDRVMWFDSDMVFTPATMRMLHADMNGEDYDGKRVGPELDMVTGLYFRRRIPHTPVLFREIDEPVKDESGKLTGRVQEFDGSYPRNNVFTVAGCGFGCVMTSVKLLRDVWDNFGPAFAPYPWAGEDISFCHRVNQLGYRIWCDSRIVCGHIGQYVYTEQNCSEKG